MAPDRPSSRERPRALLILIGVLVLAAFLALALYFHLAPARKTGELTLERTAFSALESWNGDDPAAALAAFARSCAAFAALPPGTPMGGAGYAGRAADWQSVCALRPEGAAAARAYFETNFVPYRVAGDGDEVGLFTGYYEPELGASRIKTAEFAYPIYARPHDLVSVDLGLFRDSLRGERIAGRVKDGALVPYETRRALRLGQSEAELRALAYVDDPVALFFLHIQGSGRLRFEGGEFVRVSFDGQNGHPYTAIGKILIERGEIAREAMSMQAIRAWLQGHPDRADAVMDEDASFVFFKELKIEDPALGPPGAQNVLLTPGRSLAVDRKYHPLGIPFFLDTVLAGGAEGAPFRRLMIAQDTGGAIRGAVRGDIFFGFGEDAAALAGSMNSKGRMFVLLPASLAARGEED